MRITDKDLLQFKIPKRMWCGIQRYIEHGIIPGDFLVSVITNNLKEAFARADDENVHLIEDYLRLFYNHAPNTCWGSPEEMYAWNKRGGPNEGKQDD